jgi:hypothetical protein
MLVRRGPCTSLWFSLNVSDTLSAITQGNYMCDANLDVLELGFDDPTGPVSEFTPRTELFEESGRAITSGASPFADHVGFTRAPAVGRGPCQDLNDLQFATGGGISSHGMPLNKNNALKVSPPEEASALVRFTVVVRRRSRRYRLHRPSAEGHRSDEETTQSVAAQLKSGLHF